MSLGVLPLVGRLAASVTIAVFAICPPSQANDSSASLDIGGLHLIYNPNIEMQEEDLYLSVREVRVAYKFFNKSKDDIQTLVAFPLPEIENGEGGNYGIQSDNPINVVGFEVIVNGQQLKPRAEIRAMSLGVDVTKLLEKYGLPLTTIVANDEARDRLNARIRDLPPEARRELETFGVIDWRSSFDKDGKPDANPRWTTKVTFYWLQTFAAGRVTEVRHRYRPIPRTFFTSMDEIKSERMRKSYCVDAAFTRAAQAKERSVGTLMGTELRYILSTADNWVGPIGRFSLTIDKGSANVLASMCLRGSKSTGPATFSVTKDNFQASDDLGILLLDKPSDK